MVDMVDSLGNCMQLKIKLNSNSDMELRTQLYQEIRKQIIDKKLDSGSRMPSSRDLAEDLGVSRKTVKEAYKQLITEGFLESRERSGTFVSSLDVAAGAFQNKLVPNEQQSVLIRQRLSSYGTKMVSLDDGAIGSNTSDISFFSWQPSFNTPSGDCQSIFLSRVKKFLAADTETTSNPFGLDSLRKEIAAWVGRNREIKCSYEQVAVISGYGQALDLVAKLHSGPGDVVAVEDPTYPLARNLLQSYGASILPVAVDQQGLVVEQLFNTRWTAPCKILILTPAHQFPVGCVLTLQRRVDLLRWAATTGCLIIEDDYDSEFNFQGRPVPALSALDHGGSTVYVGSFKKILPVSMCVDFMIVPEPLIPMYKRALWLSSGQLSPALQFGLAALIKSGELDKQVRKMRTMYRRRREMLLKMLSKHLGAAVQIVSDNVGLHVLIRLKTNRKDEVFIKLAAEAGVELISTRSFYAADPGDIGEYILGYATLSESEIEDGVARLARLLKRR